MLRINKPKKYVDGWKNPVFHFYDKDYNFLETIEMALCGEKGMTVKSKFVGVKRRTLIGNMDSEMDYLIKEFTMDYSSFSDLDNTMKVGDIADHVLKNHIIELVPRSEYSFNKYNVKNTNDEITLNILKGGANAQGMAGITLTFETTYPQYSMNMIDPNEVRYIGEIHPIEGILQTA